MSVGRRLTEALDDLRDAVDRRELLGQKVVVGHVDLELVSEEGEQLDHTYRVHVPALKEIGLAIEAGILGSDAKLRPDKDFNPSPVIGVHPSCPDAESPPGNDRLG